MYLIIKCVRFLLVKSLEKLRNVLHLIIFMTMHTGPTKLNDSAGNLSMIFFSFRATIIVLVLIYTLRNVPKKLPSIVHTGNAKYQ